MLYSVQTRRCPQITRSERTTCYTQTRTDGRTDTEKYATAYLHKYTNSRKPTRLDDTSRFVCRYL